MTAADGSVADALMDPWCLVALASGESVLFGYVARHPATGGLSWVVSTEVLELHPEAGRARTRSGRRYALGRRFDAADVAAEGEESRIAFDMLIGTAAEADGAVRRADWLWVVARIMARRHGVEQPGRGRTAVEAFLSREPFRQYPAGRGGDLP